MKNLVKFKKKGQGLAENGVILVLVSILSITVLSTMGDSIIQDFHNITNSLEESTKICIDDISPAMGPIEDSKEDVATLSSTSDISLPTSDISPPTSDVSLSTDSPTPHEPKKEHEDTSIAEPIKKCDPSKPCKHD